MSTILSHNVMRRVRRVYYLKRILHPTMVKLYGTCAALLALVTLVSVPDVLANTPTEAAAALSYLVKALVTTESMVQATLLLFMLLCGMIIKDVLRRAPSRIPQFSV